MTRALASAGWVLGVAAAVGLLLAYSWAEGVWSGRWQPSDASRVAAARLPRVPLIIGGWEGTDESFDERQLAVGELDGYLHRLYTNRLTGHQVQLLVVCGRPGPVSVHTPDVCYRGLGFTTLSDPVPKTLSLADEDLVASCWTADFQKPTPGGKEYLRIAWTWFAADRWQAAEHPRIEFAREPALFKAYLIHPLSDPKVVWDEDVIPKFAKELLPVLARSLRDAPASDPAEEPEDEESALAIGADRSDERPDET